jgi:hypothetical protein
MDVCRALAYQDQVPEVKPQYCQKIKKWGHPYISSGLICRDPSGAGLILKKAFSNRFSQKSEVSWHRLASVVLSCKFTLSILSED